MAYGTKKYKTPKPLEKQNLDANYYELKKRRLLNKGDSQEM
jgi:hypothetical protein